MLMLVDVEAGVGESVRYSYIYRYRYIYRNRYRGQKNDRGGTDDHSVTKLAAGKYIQGSLGPSYV